MAKKTTSKEEKKPVDIKVLDPGSKDYKDATLEMLIADAVARKDREALEWLKTESGTMVERTRKDGTVVKAKKNIATIRKHYAEDILKYQPDNEKNKAAADASRKRKQEEAEKERLELFEKAFRQLER